MIELDTDKYFKHSPLVLDKYLSTKLQKWPVNPKLYARGYSGLVYEGHHDGYSYVVKVFCLNVPIPEAYCKDKIEKECWRKSKRDFNAELNFSTKLGNLEIGPTVYDSFTGTATNDFYTQLGYPRVQIGIIVYEKYQITLRKFISEKTEKSDRERIDTFIKFAFEKFNELYIGAYDTHERNVMLNLNRNGNIKKIAIIDFGEFEKFGNRQEVLDNNEEVYKELQKDIRNGYRRKAHN